MSKSWHPKNWEEALQAQRRAKETPPAQAKGTRRSYRATPRGYKGKL